MTHNSRRYTTSFTLPVFLEGLEKLVLAGSGVVCFRKKSFNIIVYILQKGCVRYSCFMRVRMLLI